jgi:hypothetical protein
MFTVHNTQTTVMQYATDTGECNSSLCWLRNCPLCQKRDNPRVKLRQQLRNSLDKKLRDFPIKLKVTVVRCPLFQPLTIIPASCAVV